MATKNIVPNANGEGSIGTAAKGWGGAFLTSTATSSTSAGAKLQLISDDGAAAMADTHQLGIIEFLGSEDGSNTISIGASIEAVADENFTASENASALVFKTTSGTTVSEVLRLDKDKNATFAGNLGVGGSASSKLNVIDSSGGASIKVSGAITDTNVNYYGVMADATDLQGTTQVNMFYSGGAIKADTTVTDFASFRIDPPSTSATNAVITNNYGIYQASSAQKNYFGGNIILANDGTIGSSGTNDAITIASDGDIGIGDTTPEEALEIKRSSSPAIQLNQADTYKGIIRLAGNDLEIRGSANNMEFYNGGNNDGDSATLALTIDSSQNATFAGSINSSGNLQLSNASPDIFFHTTGNHYNWMIAAQENVSAALEISVDGAVGTGSDTTASNYTPVITALASGNVGIGDTAPDSRLDVVGDMGNSANAVVRLRGTNSTARTTRLQLEDYSGAIADALIDFVIPSAGSSTGSYLGMGVNGSGLKVKVDGNVEIANGSLVIANAGDGINFEAETPSESGAGSASSSVLDDYEEGTWVPTIIGASGNVATSNSTFTRGDYTKIGRLVHCSGQIVLTSLGSASGAIQMGGFPFINQNVQGAQSGGIVGTATNLNISAGHNVTFNMLMNAQNAAMRIYDDAGGITSMTASEFSADGEITFSVTYMTNT